MSIRTAGHIILLIVLCMFFTTRATEIKDHKLLIKANEHISNNNWKEASALYDILAAENQNISEIGLRAMVLAAKNDDYDKAMRYVISLENSGIPIDTILTATLKFTKQLKTYDVYEKILLSIKSNQSWFENRVNRYLLNLYIDRHQNSKVIEIANLILSKNPDDKIAIMEIKAWTYNDMGDIETATKQMTEIFELDSTNTDARLFLGNSHYLTAKEGVRYRTAGNNGKTIIQEINGAIFQHLIEAKRYLDVDFIKDKRPFVKNLIAEIDELISIYHN